MKIKFLKILLIFTFVFIVELPVFAANELPTPTINVSPDIYYLFDEILYLEGRAVPTSNVQIQFQKQGAKPLKFNVKSDANGEWVLAEKVPLSAGNWEVRARSVEATKNNPEGRTSEWSNPRIFNVIVTGITIGGVNIKFALLSFIIIFLLLTGTIVASYFILKVRRLKSELVSKEIHEAHESVREGMSHIRADLLEEKQFSKKKHLVNELDRLEHEMEHEISDIERGSGGNN